MKKICFLLCFCIMITFLVGCSNNEKEQREEQSSATVNSEVSYSQKEIQEKQWHEEALVPGIKQIVKKGKLTVAMIQDDVDVFCETKEDGTLTGIDVELAQNIANSLGVTLTVDRSYDTHDKLTDSLINGSADLVISTYSLTTDRMGYIKISDPYLTTRLGVMVNKQALVRNEIEKNPIDYMKSNPVKIAAIRNSSHANNVLEMFPNSELVEMNTYDEMCQAVRSGEVFGYLCGEAKFLLDYTLDPELSLYTQVFVFSDALEKYCIGVSPNNPDLLQFVNAYLNSSKSITMQDVEKNAKQHLEIRERG